ncbi:sterol desaturase family protein [Methylovirgula sp. 4M-Z18]|uniref:sterol desaturase family protein n=1 Tax=Methylovirgula sp. 4M-Z18 TaxID=2293567 RepID=UPI000E2F83D9|nr:sterol desaturase family protein [Methylovirgula sp. 4M-Z18]RFB80714.1 sterol desaturase family protein [Methylovirgula sp. 4M-Z18]
MDDLKYGKRNKRGDWAPNLKIEIAPIWALPPKLGAVLKWLPHYFLPWNLFFAAFTLVYWYVVVPEVDVLRTLSWWVLRLFVVNAIALLLFFGAFEIRLYILRAQGSRFKYNSKWPGEQRNAAFWFQNQNIDNLIRTFGTGLPIWTAVEAGTLWAYANGYAPWLRFAEHPWYLAALALVVPVIHEAHFFAIHRLIHTPRLYKWVHSVHHNSVNPSPWSSLSMHPVEHLLYFGVALWHLVFPSNPILALYQLHYAGFGAVVGHIGFDKIEFGGEAALDSHAYTHYLHHKYFEVNYGDGLVPFDKLFGTWHDGTAEGDAHMQARYERRKARAN